MDKEADLKILRSITEVQTINEKLREENVRLRQRVEELERRLARESKLLVECIKTRGELGERMIAAEARLAKVVEALGEAAKEE